MQVELVWSSRALDDLVGIYVSVGLTSAEAAERIYTALRVRVGALQEFPRMRARHPEIGKDARILVEGTYLVLYELEPDQSDEPVQRVVIIRVVDGRRDLFGLAR